MDSAAVKWLALSLCLVAVQAQSRQKWFSEGQKTLADALAKRHNEGVAKNIVFFLGDGMGVSTITAARILKGQNDGGNGEEYKLTMEKLPFTGLIKVYNTNQQVPDSAGTATSFYTGVKTRAGVLGVDESVVRDDCTNLEDGALETIQDWALKEGKSVGLVSTARITHATPGAAYAKIPNRDWECDADIRGVNCDGKVKDIALQLIDNYEQIQVLMGGGRSNFIPRETPDPGYPTQHGSRADGRDLVQEWKDKQAALGRKFEYVWNNDQLKQVDTNQTDSLFGLFNPSHMTYDHGQTRNRSRK